MPTDLSPASEPFSKLILSSEVTGSVTWIGTILTVVGLCFTFYQAREARKAAIDAATGATEAERAVRRIEHQNTLSDAAHVSSQIELIVHLISSQQYHAIQLLFGTVKRHIMIMLVRSPPPEDQEELIRKNLNAANRQISNSINEPAKFKPTLLTKSLTGLSGIIVEWEQNLKSQQHPG